MTLILMKFAGGGTEKFEVSFSREKLESNYEHLKNHFN